MVTGSGETEVLSYALAHPPLRAVIDDMDARRCAQTLGIPIFGTGGLQVLAKRRGLLRSVGEAITKLRGAGLWLSEELVQILPIRFVAKVIENAKSPHQFSSTRSENATHAAGRIHSPGNSFDVFGNKPDRHGTNLAGASG